MNLSLSQIHTSIKSCWRFWREIRKPMATLPPWPQRLNAQRTRLVLYQFIEQIKELVSSRVQKTCWCPDCQCATGYFDKSDKIHKLRLLSLSIKISTKIKTQQLEHSEREPCQPQCQPPCAPQCWPPCQPQCHLDALWNPKISRTYRGRCLRCLHI